MRLPAFPSLILTATSLWLAAGCPATDNPSDLAVPDLRSCSPDDLGCPEPVDFARTWDFSHPDGDVCMGQLCAVDFPCRNASVCSDGGVQTCKSTYYNGGPSPECSQIPGCVCCSGGSCGLGVRVACPPGTVCIEYTGSLSVSASCLPLDAGLPPGSEFPPDGGGRSCAF